MSAEPSAPPALLITPMPDGSWRVEVTNGRMATAQPSAPTAEPLVDSKAMAKLLGCGDTLVEAMARDGRIPSIRVGLPNRNGEVKGLRFEPSKVIAALRLTNE